ncbi:MAG: hypothetical protein R2762_23075 [Bryobacteraceae bacterium]
MRIPAYLLVVLLAGLLDAATPTAWEMTTYQDFVKGKFENIALSKDGRLSLAPQLQTLFASEEPAVWSLAMGTDGDVYLGTGHRGKLYRIDKAGKSEAIFTAPETEIFALAIDSAGRLYAGASPGGKVYRIDRGKVEEYFSTGATYVWSLTFGRDGALFVGTGGEGKIFRVTAAGRGELYYETGQGHVTSLAVDSSGYLLAGTEPNGILYRVTAKDKAFVLYDATLPEIRSLAVAADGSVYAGAMGGSVAKQTKQAPGTKPQVTSTVTVSAAPTTITVTDESVQQGELKPKPAEAAAQTSAAQPADIATSVIDYPGVEKSAIYRIRPDLTVETLWSSTEENAYDLALTPRGLLFATDNQGRVYSLDDRRRATLMVETRDGEALRLLSRDGSTWVVTGSPGKLYRLNGTHARKGEFESTVHDTASASRWGKLSWSGTLCQGCRVALRARTGNSARPDKTWSDWSAPLTDSSGSAIPNPNARYVQWKVEMEGGASASPSLDWVRLPYLPQNARPVLRSLTVSAQTASAGAAKNATASSATYSITVTDTGDAGASSASGTATQPLTRASREQILVSWLGEDSDGDKLSYTIHFRPEGESNWTLLKEDQTETLYLLDAEAFADGRYYFRVTASDRLSNPAGDAREEELVSAPILVDRTPPTVRLGTPSRSANGLEVGVEVQDSGSPLKACEYSVDAGSWMPLAPVDGVLDSGNESFVVRLTAAEAGKLVVVRARDSADNAGLARVVAR